MTEFMNKFMISPPKTPHVHLQNNAMELECVTPRDTIQQYNNEFNNLRKATVNTQSNVNSSSSVPQGVNPAKLNLNNN